MIRAGMSERRRRGTSLATRVTVAGVGFGLLVAAVFWSDERAQRVAELLGG
jgi:hypothetical protein